MSAFLKPLLLLLLLLFNAASMKKDCDDFCCCCNCCCCCWWWWCCCCCCCCWLCACKLFWNWLCCCRCRRALCRWLLIFGCVVCELWNSGDDEDVVDGVGVGGGAIGDAPHVWIFSNGFLKLFVSLAAPFGNDPYARNIFFCFSRYFHSISSQDLTFIFFSFFSFLSRFLLLRIHTQDKALFYRLQFLIFFFAYSCASYSIASALCRLFILSIIIWTCVILID